MPQGQGAVGLDASPLTGGQAAMVTATAGPTGVGGPAQAMLSPQGPGAAVSKHDAVDTSLFFFFFLHMTIWHMSGAIKLSQFRLVV